MKTAVLLIQLGTPDSPSTSDVRRYLREFLSDPAVIDIPTPLRWALVNLIIAPFRSPKSAHAYQQIWTKRGSPLKAATEDLVTAVRPHLPSGFALTYAMRYGSPSIESVIRNLLDQKVDHFKVIPLYPQYAMASTGSSVLKVREILKRLSPRAQAEFLPPFYREAFFIESFIESARQTPGFSEAEHFVFSYHGIPERQIKRLDEVQFCLKKPAFDCCERMQKENEFCYRAHCVQTTQALVSALKLSADRYSLTFQSRLGRTPWLSPYTDFVIPELAATQGVKRLAVFSPSFVADCLETIEEIGMRARASFLAAGGEEFILIPAPNASPRFAKGIAEFALSKGA